MCPYVLYTELTSVRTPAGAAHIAFPASSKDAVSSFFVRALKAGGKFHGEPKTRDSDSGYYSAAILDFDGNSIEAVYRPSSSSAKSEVSVSPRGLLMEGSVVSKSSSRVSAAKPESYIAPKSVARSPESQVSKASAADRAAPYVTSQQQPERSTAPTYIMQTNQKTDDGKAAKTIVGTLIGAAAGAAIAYAMSKGDSQSSESVSPLQEAPRESAQLPPPSQTQSQAPPQTLESPHGYKFIEAPPARSTYSQNDGRPMLTRSVTSKNPRASTIYEGTEFIPQPGPSESVYLDDHGRRASDGSVYSTRDIPLRAIEYTPGSYPCNPSTLISSFHDKPRQMSTGSIHSSSTIKPSKSTSHQDTHSAYYSIPKSQAPSTASSTRTARKVPLPQGSSPSISSYRSTPKSLLSARNVALPESVAGNSAVPEEFVTPDDSVSQVGGGERRSTTHSHRSKTGSRASRRSSKFDEPVRPSDSVSQVSSHVSQRTLKAGADLGGSKAGSKVSSRRGSQAW